jgi:hypothetical protein
LVWSAEVHWELCGDLTWNGRREVCQLWFEVPLSPLYVSFSMQSIDDLNKWALVLVSPFILEAEHIAFVTESIWVQGDSFQRPSSPETVSIYFLLICHKGNNVS